MAASLWPLRWSLTTGPIRDAIAANMKEWLTYLEYSAGKGQERGQLIVDITPRQIVFELHAFYLAANLARQLLGDTQAPNRARSAILSRLNTLTTDAAALPALTHYLAS